MPPPYPYCLFRENGCPWLTPQCGLYTIAKGEMKLWYHSTGCIYSLLVAQERQHKREQEAVEKGLRWEAEAR